MSYGQPNQQFPNYGQPHQQAPYGAPGGGNYGQPSPASSGGAKPSGGFIAIATVGVCFAVLLLNIVLVVVFVNTLESPAGFAGDKSVTLPPNFENRFQGPE